LPHQQQQQQQQQQHLLLVSNANAAATYLKDIDRRQLVAEESTSAGGDTKRSTQMHFLIASGCSYLSLDVFLMNTKV